MNRPVAGLGALKPAEKFRLCDGSFCRKGEARMPVHGPFLRLLEPSLAKKMFLPPVSLQGSEPLIERNYG
jgi:hypothetical protein